MCPKFQIYKDSAGKTRFRLRADNNQIVASGEAYEQHDGCIKAITSILNNRNAPVVDFTAKGDPKVPNPKFEVYKDSDDKYRFRLRATNGEIIAQGEAYDSKQACLSGIELVRGSYLATVEDPFATEVVIESELPRTPAISISVPKRAHMVFRFIDPEPKQEKASLPVISLLTLLGFEFAFGLTEGVMKAVGRTNEASVESISASVQ